MYKNILELKTKDRCNYVIEISPNNNNIFLSLNEQGYILPKEDFLLLDEQKLNTINNSKIPISLFNLEDTISNAKFTSDNKNIFISDQTKNIIKFNLSQDNTGGEHEQTDKTILNIKNLKTWKFVINSEKGIMATGGNNIFIYDYINNKILKEIENKNKFVYSFCFLSNNKLATGNSNGSIYIYDTETFNKENKIEEHCLLVRNLAFNNNKNILYSASDDLHINQIDANTLKLFSPMVGHKEPISDMIYNEKKNILITSSFDGTIKVWDIKANNNNNCINTLEPSNKSPIWDITVSQEADFIAYTATEGIGAFILK
jgi:WD40 repeat protein